MPYEDDVLRAVADGFVYHAKFYFDTYRTVSPEEQAKFRSAVIDHEHSWATRNINDSASLRLAEYLDAHPSARDHVQQMLAHVEHNDKQLGIYGDGRVETRAAHEARENAEIANQELHILTGNSLGAIFQGISNELFEDPAEALRAAAPFVTASEMLMAHGEALQTRHERSHELESSFRGEHMERLANELGREEVDAIKNEMGSASENPWNATAGVLGEARVDALNSAIGKEAVHEAAEGLQTPQSMPGHGTYHGAESETPPPPSESGSADLMHELGIDIVDPASPDIDPGMMLPDDGSSSLDPGMMLPDDGSGSVDPGMTLTDDGSSSVHHDGGMSLPDDGSSSVHHDGGMSLPDDGSSSVHHDGGMSLPDDGSSAGHHDPGMSLPDDAGASVHDAGMSVPDTAANVHHDAGMSAPDDGSSSVSQ